jgi:hypothetical protein
MVMMRYNILLSLLIREKADMIFCQMILRIIVISQPKKSSITHIEM